MELQGLHKVEKLKTKLATLVIQVNRVALPIYLLFIIKLAIALSFPYPALAYRKDLCA